MEVPRRLRFAIRRYGLDERRVLDLGCGPGLYLRHFGPGSVGLDLNPKASQEAGLDARRWDFTEGIPSDIGEFDAIWCSNLLEHVLAPHAFLIDLRGVLRTNGLLLVVVPQTTRFKWGPWRGWMAQDHVNFFTPHTLAHTVRRAGYELDFLGSPAAPVLPQMFRIGPTLLAACRPIPDFQYGPKTYKRLVAGRIEFQ